MFKQTPYSPFQAIRHKMCIVRSPDSCHRLGSKGPIVRLPPGLLCLCTVQATTEHWRRICIARQSFTM
ncbi:hypothetical protein OESDEN_05746 [Oesophagostomum dentatum]|uniref:Uncharacterized protein n=1 Tax=Oesophagostomum dentatum TaxID=61180 RepID=A0A0B1TFY9_OESDE|nr:hypothetical protein OESDEN_05746 [Oesophagostomum dentatum]